MSLASKVLLQDEHVFLVIMPPSISTLYSVSQTDVM